MAIYCMMVSRISRGKGKSVVAASAYRSGEKIKNEHDNHTHDYEERPDVAYAEIFIPDDAPSWAQNRSALWNEVERSEKRIDANTARQIEVALPRELDPEQQIELIHDYANYFVQKHKMCVDACLHDKQDGNPHVHFLLTTREMTGEGLSKKKIADLDKKDRVIEWRKEWEVCANQALERAGREERIDCRSYKDQGIDRKPMVHLGPTVAAMERRGVPTKLGEVNKKIQEYNKVMSEWKEAIKEAFALKRADNLERYAADQRRANENKEMVARLLEKARNTIEKPKEEKVNVLQKLNDVELKIEELERELYHDGCNSFNGFKARIDQYKVDRAEYLKNREKLQVAYAEHQNNKPKLNIFAMKKWREREVELKNKMEGNKCLGEDLENEKKLLNVNHETYKNLAGLRKEKDSLELTSEVKEYRDRVRQKMLERKLVRERKKVKSKERDGWER